MVEHHLGLDEALHIADLAGRVRSPSPPDEIERARERLREVVPSIPEAVQCLVEERRIAEAARLVGGLSGYWQDTGQVDQGRQLTRRVLESADAVNPVVLAPALLTEGELAFQQGDQEVARLSSASAVALALDAGDPWVEGLAQLNLARVAVRDEDVDSVRRHASVVVAIGEELDDDPFRAAGTHMSAWAAYAAGDVDEAMRLFEESVAAHRRTGDRVSEAGELINIAELCCTSGDLVTAQRALVDALAVVEVEAASSHLAPSLLMLLGTLRGLQGEHTDAVRWSLAAESLYRRAGRVPGSSGDLARQVFATATAGIGPRATEALHAEVDRTDAGVLVQQARAALDTLP